MRKLTLKKKLLFSTITFAISGMAIVCLLEIGLRIRDHVATSKMLAELENDPASVPIVAADIPGLFYRLKPKFKFGNIEFNEYGFNMPPREKKKGTDVYRIMIIGDSVTQGTGTTATSQAFPNRMEALLSGKRLHGKRIEVWNCGVAGYNAEQILVSLKNVLPPFAPDMVIYYTNFNDYWPASSFFAGQVRNGTTNTKARSSSPGLLDRLKRFRTVVLVKAVYDELYFWKNGYVSVYVDMKINYPGWKDMKRTILDMQSFCKEQDYLFVVGVHPREQFLYKHDDLNLAHRDLMRFLDENQIRVLDPIESMRAKKSESLYLKDGDHCTPRGYEVLAESLIISLNEHQWWNSMLDGE